VETCVIEKHNKIKDKKMATFDIFSKRQKRLRGEIPDVYAYDVIPDKLRVQVVHIARDAIGECVGYGCRNYPQDVYTSVFDTLCREYGRFSLADVNRNDSQGQVLNFILQTRPEEVIDTVELIFQTIDKTIRDISDYTDNTVVKTSPDEAIKDLNERFRENGIGY
jgi:hypothetical protein